MGICLRHVEAVVRDRFFFTDFVSVCSLKKLVGEKTHHVMDSPIHGEHNGASCNSVLRCVCKLQSFL